MNVKKITAATLSVLIVCGLCFSSLTGCKKKQKDESSSESPASSAVSTGSRDVEVEDYKEYDWKNTAGNTSEKDKPFAPISDGSNNNQTNQSPENSSDDGLIHNESKNAGIEVEFDLWDRE